MKKEILVAGILFMLLIGIVSANVLSYFGRITGSVEVNGPVFYLSCEKSDVSDKSYKLLINDDATGECTRTFTDGYSNLWFVTESLGVESLYEADYEMSIRIRNTHASEVGQVLTEVWIIKENGDLKYAVPIAAYAFRIQNQTTMAKTVVLDVDDHKLDSTDRLGLKFSDGLHDITYEMFIEDGDSKMQVFT